MASLPLMLIAISGIGLSFLGSFFEWETGALTPANKAPAVALPPSLMIAKATESQKEGFRPLGVFAPQSRLEVDAAMVFGLPVGAQSSADAIIVGIDPTNGDVLGSITLHETWSHTLLRFHHHLLVGETGATLFAVTAIMLIAFIVSGAILWAARSGTAAKKLQIAGHAARRGSAFGLHSLIGIGMGLFLFIWAMSGVLWSRPGWFAPFLPSAISNLTDHQTAELGQQCAASVTLDSAVQRAEALSPKAAISQILLPNAQQPYFTITLKAAGDLDRYYGDTYVFIHSQCADVAIVRSVQRSDISQSIRAINASLHSGRLFGGAGVWLTSTIGVAIVVMTATGLIAFTKRTIRRKAS